MTELLKIIDRIPPCLCRVLARKLNGRRGLSHRELARKIGICKSTVADISMRTSWRGIRVEIVEAFASACGVDLFTPCKVRSYLKNTKHMHILNCHKNRKRMFKRIFSLIGDSNRGVV